MLRNALILLCAIGIFSILTGCSGEPQEPGNGPDEPGPSDLIEAELEEEFLLPIGEEAVIKGEDLRIRFESVIEDSRCPLNVQCIWEGRASYMLDLTLGDYSSKIVLTEPGLGGRGEDTFLDYYITANLEPYPETPDEADEADYQLRITVSKARG